MSWFLSFYYLANLALILTYPLCWIWFLEFKSPGLMPDILTGMNWENQILCICIVYQAIRVKKAYSWDHYFANCINLTHLTVLILFWFSDRRLLVYYLIGIIVFWLFLRQPKYDGLSKIVILKNKDELEEFVGAAKEKGKSEKKKESKNFAETNAALVVFTDRFCETCKYTAPIWASFSNRFSTTKLKFAELDVTHLAALKQSLCISQTTFSSKLPVLILY